MLEQLKRKTMPGKLALAAVWLVLGGVLFAYLFPSLLLLIRGPQDFYALTTDQLEGISLSGGELRGAVVTSYQASELARLLGVIIRDDPDGAAP